MFASACGASMLCPIAEREVICGGCLASCLSCPIATWFSCQNPGVTLRSFFGIPKKYSKKCVRMCVLLLVCFDATASDTSNPFRIVRFGVGLLYLYGFLSDMHLEVEGRMW